MYLDLTIKVEKDNPIFQEREVTPRQLMAMGHVGTHIDVYLETEIPLENMQGEAILFDVSGIEGRDVELKDFAHDKVKENDFVIFKTDMVEKLGYGTREYFREHLEFANEVVQFLISKKVRFIGLDSGGVRRGKEHVAIDKLCEENGIFVIENLTNLDKVVEGGKERFQVTTLWLELADNTGLPCRVVASI